MNHHLCNNCRTFYNTSIWCKIAPKYSKSTCSAVWIINWADNFWVQVYTVFDVLTNCLASYSHALCMKKSLLVQLVHNCIYATCFVQVFHVSRTCRCKVTDVRSLCTDLICKADIKIPANLMCDCRKNLSKAVHTVCSVHTGTGATSWTCLVLALGQALLCKLTCCISTNSFKHTGKTGLVSV